MGNESSDVCCYCCPYNEEGEYNSKYLSLNSSDRNNNNNNNDRSSNNDRRNNSGRSSNNARLYNTFNFILNQILLGEEGAQNGNDNNNNIQMINFSSQLLDNDVSQLDSIILKNIDDLSPEKKRCTICLENFIKFDKIINLSCLHMFHDSCIKTWLKKNDYCPICKNKIEF